MSLLTFTYLCVLLGGIFSFISTNAGNKFMGSSTFLKATLLSTGNFGYLLFYGSLIYLLFKVTWWHPIVILILAVIAAPLLNFKNTALRTVLGLIAIVGVYLFGLIGLALIYNMK